MDFNFFVHRAAQAAEAAMAWAYTAPDQRGDVAPWMGRELARLLDVCVVARLLPDLVELHERVRAIEDALQSGDDGPSVAMRLRRIEDKIDRIHAATGADEVSPWSE